MPQLSFFDDLFTPPETFDDISALGDSIYEGEKDKDWFTDNDITGGKSYSFYGTKVFEFLPRKTQKSATRLNVCKEVYADMGLGEASAQFTTVQIESEEDMERLRAALRKRKQVIFRNLISETFGCCNDFMRCSEAEACIHKEDRFFNGCMYRSNLEQGKIFYGPKRNVD